MGPSHSGSRPKVHRRNRWAISRVCGTNMSHFRGCHRRCRCYAMLHHVMESDVNLSKQGIDYLSVVVV